MSHPDRFLLAGLMGWPVMHSRSPKLHNYWFEKHGLAGTYVPLAIEPGKLGPALRALRSLGLIDAWDWVDDTLKPLRMTLFFLLSGIFASSSIDRPWRSVFRKRVGSPYYLYVVWLLLQWPFFAYFTGIGMNRTHGFAELRTVLLPE